jgi:hypothetical protein
MTYIYNFYCNILNCKIFLQDEPEIYNYNYNYTVTTTTAEQYFFHNIRTPFLFHSCQNL